MLIRRPGLGARAYRIQCDRDHAIRNSQFHLVVFFRQLAADHLIRCTGCSPTEVASLSWNRLVGSSPAGRRLRIRQPGIRLVFTHEVPETGAPSGSGRHAAGHLDRQSHCPDPERPPWPRTAGAVVTRIMDPCDGTRATALEALRNTSFLETRSCS